MSYYRYLNYGDEWQLIIKNKNGVYSRKRQKIIKTVLKPLNIYEFKYKKYFKVGENDYLRVIESKLYVMMVFNNTRTEINKKRNDMNKSVPQFYIYIINKENFNCETVHRYYKINKIKMYDTYFYIDISNSSQNKYLIFDDNMKLSVSCELPS